MSFTLATWLMVDGLFIANKDINHTRRSYCACIGIAVYTNVSTAYAYAIGCTIDGYDCLSHRTCNSVCGKLLWAVCPEAVVSQVKLVGF